VRPCHRLGRRREKSLFDFLLAGAAFLGGPN
jgi:hypothetical protein